MSAREGMRVQVHVACVFCAWKSPSQKRKGKCMHNLLCTDKYGFFLLLSAFYVSELREGEEAYVRLI